MKHACQQATKLASDAIDRPLSTWESVRLRFHLLLCGNCRNCKRSMQIIHETADLIRRSSYGEFRLSKEQRERLLNAIETEVDC